MDEIAYKFGQGVLDKLSRASDIEQTSLPCSRVAGLCSSFLCLLFNDISKLSSQPVMSRDWKG